MAEICPFSIVVEGVVVVVFVVNTLHLHALLQNQLVKFQ